MATDSGPASDDLTWLARLAESPGAFGFHAALRRFDAAFPGAPRVGESEHASQDRVRLGQRPSSAFESSEIVSFAAANEGRPAALAVGFLGLWGPNGPLPLHMTEYVQDRVRHAGDSTFAAFADLFHHRMLSLLHRAWARSQPVAALDRVESDAFARHLGALFGLGLDATRRRDGSLDFDKLHYAGQLASSVRNPEGLADMLQDHFGLPVHIEEFVGGWLDLPADACWRLAESPDTGTLGKTIVLGRRVWSRAHCFRVHVGPLTAEQFERMLPTSGTVERVCAMVRLYTNDEWDWELYLLLDQHTVVPMRLGGGGRLGWSTRIGSNGGSGVTFAFDPTSKRTRRAPPTRSGDRGSCSAGGSPGG